MAEADAALQVADDDERGEAEATATLDHLGDAIDVNELIDETVVVIVPAIITVITRRHILVLVLFRRRPWSSGPA